MRHILFSCVQGEVEGWVDADADLDGAFILIRSDAEQLERIRVNGWLGTVVDCTGPALPALMPA
jgi:hypothetical protein